MAIADFSSRRFFYSKTLDGRVFTILKTTFCVKIIIMASVSVVSASTAVPVVKNVWSTRECEVLVDEYIVRKVTYVLHQ